VDDKIRLSREDLFTPEIDNVVAQQEALARAMPAPEPASTWRRIMLSSMFFLALAGALGGCIGWLILEPFLNEAVVIHGTIKEIELPTFIEGEGRQLLVKDFFVYVDDEYTRISGAGAYGELEEGGPGISSYNDLEPGMPVTATCIIFDPEQDALLATRLVVHELSAEEESATPPNLRSQTIASFLSGVLLFAIVGTCIAGLIAAADGFVSRNLKRGLLSGACGIGIAAAGGLILLCPGGMVFGLTGELAIMASDGPDINGLGLMILVVGRALTWGILGLTVGLGQGVALRSKKLFLNGLLGGMLGGLLGGMFFDPIDKLMTVLEADIGGQAIISRGVGFSLIGLSAGLMIGLVEHLAKDAWLLMRGGPLAGKEFVIYKSPTTIGSSPKCEIYLFKDAEVEPQHALIIKVGNRHEIEDLGSPAGTYVNGQKIKRQILQNGDQIVIGQTALEFAERARGQA
jgi:hypothetical protein